MTSSQSSSTATPKRPLLVLPQTSSTVPSSESKGGNDPPGRSPPGAKWVLVDDESLRDESPTPPAPLDPDSKVPAELPRTDLIRTARLLNRGRGSRLAYFRTRMNYETTLVTPANASYIWTFATIGSTLVNTWLGSTVEWSAINSIFEEFFIHSMSVGFEPVNQFSNQRLTTTATDLQSCALSVAGYQHNQGAGADGASLSSALMNSNQSQRVSSARHWTFVWKNVEKFDRKGPGGDATTAQNTQSWLNNGSVSKVGGFVQIASFFPGQTAGDNSHLLAARSVGTVMVTWDVSFRYRD